MAAPLQFWFDFASTYSYVAALRVEQACARAGVPLSFQPFLLGPIFTAQLGIKDSPFNVRPERGRYMWRDLERLCQKHGIPWNRPGAFPRGSILPARVALAGEGQGWVPAFIKRTFAANFSEDRDIGDAQVIESLLTALGADARDLLERAASPGIKARLRAQTDEAARLGIFGAPNCVTAGELFFGQDRLEDAIAWAAAR